MAKPSLDPSRPPHGSFFGHPEGLRTLFFLEMWERFSYYGLRPLLVLFMAAALGEGGFALPRDQASSIVGIYGAGVYLASLPGGWLADRLLGLRRAIFSGAVLISCGHLCIGLSGLGGAAARLIFYLGLTFIVFGTGLLKPNISAIVGDLYPEGGARRDAGFSIFYMGINVGALLGQLVTGFLGEVIGWHWGFGAAGVGMLAGLAGYWRSAGRTLGDIGLHPPRHPDPLLQARREQGAKRVVRIALALCAAAAVLVAIGVPAPDPRTVGMAMAWLLTLVSFGYFGLLLLSRGLTAGEKKRVGVIAVLFLFGSVFWSAFEQAPGALNLFAADFTDRRIGGFLMPATWFQSVNSLFIILLAPVSALAWERLAARGRELSIPTKFVLGLLFAAIGFAVMVPAARLVEAGGAATRVSPWWLVASYFFQTVGELCLSPVGLSSMTRLSPRRLVGQMLGMWYLASAMGNLVGGLTGGRVDPRRLEGMAQLFGYTAAALLAAGVLLALLVPPLRRVTERNYP
ncbi:MAG TPA: peptide MFS transporter [Verrucomicrobiae bacterium]|nr:peptide MFS transporter [Verrucomicrobiae bacterium]